MAATNYTPISLYYSTTAAAVPLNTSLVNGELAINITDKKLYAKDAGGVVFLLASESGATGSVSTVSVVSTNGFAGTVANATTTPAITLTTSVTGVLKGNGTAISAAVSGTDYAPATSGTSILYGNGAGGFSNVTIGTGVSFAGGSLSATGTGGTVTSVAQSFTGGLISVGGSPVTGSGTLALTVAGTSGGIPYFSSGTTWATSAALAANSLVIGGGAGAAPATVTTGSGVVTALGVNTGSTGAFVVNGGVLGTPSSGTLTNATGLPISTGVSGLGTGVATALAVNTGTVGAVVVNGGALGTPSSGTLTNCTFPTLNQNTTGSAATFTSTTQNSQFNSIGVGTAASATAGEIRATNNVTAYYSDDRLKTKLGVIESALDKVLSLSGFYYEANATAQALGYTVQKEVGVSAQEVQAVLPEAVAPAPIDEQYLTVRYERIVPLLIEAIKELQAEVKALKHQ